MPDRRHHGEGEHDERHVAMPAMPGAGFVMIEAQLVLGRLEAVLDRPAMSFDRDDVLDPCSCRTPCREERQVAVADGATDQQASCPQAATFLVIFGGVEIREFEVGPVMKPRALSAITRRQTLSR